MGELRFPSGGAYGTRVDGLLELLEGRAEEMTKARRAKIEQGLRDW